MATTPHGVHNYVSNPMGIPAHDYIGNTYDGNNVIATEYRLGGATGTVVAVLNMTYDTNGNVLTVTRTV